jgi:hypothetical protein
MDSHLRIQLSRMPESRLRTYDFKAFGFRAGNPSMRCTCDDFLTFLTFPHFP